MTKYLALAAAAVLTAGVSAQAGVVTSWENTTDGWGGGLTFSNTIGVTHGSYSAVRDVPEGWSTSMQFGWDKNQTLALFIANPVLTVDVYVPNAVPPGAYLQVGLQFWDNGAGAANPFGGFVNLAQGANHIELDSSFHTFGDLDTATYGAVAIVTNTTAGYAPGLVYFDNAQFVPEPTSISLLALSGMALLKRRKA